MFFNSQFENKQMTLFCYTGFGLTNCWTDTTATRLQVPRGVLIEGGSHYQKADGNQQKLGNGMGFQEHLKFYLMLRSGWSSYVAIHVLFWFFCITFWKETNHDKSFKNNGKRPSKNIMTKTNMTTKWFPHPPHPHWKLLLVPGWTWPTKSPCDQLGEKRKLSLVP